MQFKEWMNLSESGQTLINGGPRDITVMFRGAPTTFRKVVSVDPRFERQNIPRPKWSFSKGNKFLGEVDFALPIVNQNGKVVYWLNSHRNNPLSGTGSFGFVPTGVEAPLDWADFAQINGAEGHDLTQQHNTVPGSQSPRHAVNIR